MMTSKVAQWGNSQAVRLPAELALASGFKQGTPVRLVKTETGILIERVRQRSTLADLLRNTPAKAEVAGWDANGKAGTELL